ncbi:hypothetical protein [Psychroserpens ponticola]|uniref:Lipoprotein n=1 Tax=Psychroserpens ponticola TaxID=2932268 RepID=A0ABY7S2H2_9FLAO|nr:hypothetical protein [Psychroserpens ponticola]WCO03599.1 hypothetical protein MUN68_008830 [Psychroserpens ponticola]
MKKSIKFLLLILLILSCSTNSEKEQFIGNWSTGGFWNPIEFQFFKDSLIVDEMGLNYLNNWEFDSRKLYVTKLIGNGPEIEEEIIFDYKLSRNKDSLYLKRESDSTYNVPLMKIKNGFDYLKKSVNLSIDLPISNTKLTQNNFNECGLNIYVGYNNEKLIARTDRYIGVTLHNITREAARYYSCYETNQFNVFVNLIADKSVPKSDIDSLKSIIRETEINKILRIYKNDKTAYEKTGWKDKLEWFGIYE